MKYCKDHFRTVLALVVALCLPGCGSAPLTTKVLDRSGLSKSSAITILDFSARDTSVRYSGNADSLGHAMAMLVQKELQNKGAGLSTSLSSGGPITTDLVLEGRFTKIDEGDAVARIMVGAEGVTVAVEGKIRKSTGENIAEFSKTRTSSGGPLGLGGLLAGESDVIINDIMEEIAEDLAEFIVVNR